MLDNVHVTAVIYYQYSLIDPQRLIMDRNCAEHRLPWDQGDHLWKNIQIFTEVKGKKMICEITRSKSPLKNESNEQET